MPVEITNLNLLDQTTIEDSLALLKSYLEVEYPSMDLEPGSVLHSLLLRPAAIFHTLNQTNLDRVRQSQSLLKIAEDPTLADDDIVNAVLSNFNVTRKDGGQATGSISMIFTTNDFVAIPSSAVFSANGVDFSPVEPIFGVASNPTASNNIVYATRSDATYSLTFLVQAITTGEAGNLGKDTTLTADSSAFPNLIVVTAAEDFDGGADTESNTDLLSRITNGIASPSMASRSSIKALIQNTFSGVTDVSVIGAGDAEMLRDSHSTLGVKSFGKADVYVRTRSRPITLTISKQATLINIAQKTFHLNFARDEYAGLYWIDSIKPTGSTAAGTLPISYVTRDTDPTDIPAISFVPAMVGSESAFTRYQTVEVEFTSDTTDTTGLSTGDKVSFDVTLTYLPDIDKVNDWLLDRSRRHPGGDYLVKAPIPCFVGVAMRIIVGYGDALPDTEAIKAAVVESVNNISFSEGQLDSSVIINAAQSLLTGKSRVETPIDFRGRVIKPNGKETWIFNQHKLVIPTLVGEMISPRTVAFFLSSNDIVVEAVPTNALPV
jgi:hypothetical protein